MPRWGSFWPPAWQLRYRGARGRDSRPIEEMCRDLLSARGEVSGTELARRILDRYVSANEAQRRAFFDFLANDLDLEPSALAKAAQDYETARDPTAYAALTRAAEPGRQELARRLNQVPGATGRLVAMREDLLRFCRDSQDLARVDQDFRHLFRSWFNRGFLVLQRIDWDSPAAVLEKLIEYEAVHAIENWDDLRRRTEPEDRRCFAFFHPSMPDEPLIFVEVALTRGIPNSIQGLLKRDRAQIGLRDADTAVFYSISNCQDGLAGISFGSSLIKQVVADLSRELPRLSTFVTLSPIPGLRRWAEGQGIELPEGAQPLRRLAARYLLTAKRGDQPADPVARFHLGNGALVHEVHAGADTSASGQAQSGGAMVNYLYNPGRIAVNHEAYAAERRIVASRSVAALARSQKEAA